MKFEFKKRKRQNENVNKFPPKKNKRKFKLEKNNKKKLKLVKLQKHSLSLERNEGNKALIAMIHIIIDHQIAYECETDQMVGFVQVIA